MPVGRSIRASRTERVEREQQHDIPSLKDGALTSTASNRFDKDITRGYEITTIQTVIQQLQGQLQHASDPQSLQEVLTSTIKSLKTVARTLLREPTNADILQAIHGLRLRQT